MSTIFCSYINNGKSGQSGYVSNPFRYIQEEPYISECQDGNVFHVTPDWKYTPNMCNEEELAVDEV